MKSAKKDFKDWFNQNGPGFYTYRSLFSPNRDMKQRLYKLIWEYNVRIKLNINENLRYGNKLMRWVVLDADVRTNSGWETVRSKACIFHIDRTLICRNGSVIHPTAESEREVLLELVKMITQLKRPLSLIHMMRLAKTDRTHTI